MADNFLQSIKMGIDLGHSIDTQRVQREQMERMAIQMQMAVNDQIMQQQAFIQAQEEKAARKAAYSPGGEGYKSLERDFPDHFGTLARQMVDSGKIDPGYATLVKAQKEKAKTGFTLGDQRYEFGPDGKPVVVATNPKPDKPVAIRTVDLGDEVEVYENGVLARTVTKGKSPGTEGTAKPQQTSFVDEESGKPLIFDPKTGTYIIANVNSGGISPKPVNPSATEREKTASFAVIRDQLDRIEKSYKSRYVGLISGQIGRVTQWKDSDEAAFRQIVLDVKDSLLRARSGAQINEQEYARLAKLVPDFTDSEAQFAGKMKSFKATFEAIARERVKAQKAGGVKLKVVPNTIGRFKVEVE